MSGNPRQQSRTVQQYVEGEASSSDFGFSTVRSSVNELREPEAAVHSTEPSLSEETDLAEGLHKGEVKPTPTVEQRRYSIDWDPLR